jgi:membrane protein
MRDRLPPWAAGIYDVLEAAVHDGSEHELPLFAPAMAYALVVSLAPLTLALNTFGSLFVTADAAIPNAPLDPAELSAEMMIEGVAGWAGPFASVVGVLLVLYGATALYNQLVTALRRIWYQPHPPKGLVGVVRGRLFAMLLLVATAVGLFLSAVLGTALAGFAQALTEVGGTAGVDLWWFETAANSRVLVDFLFSAVLYTVALTVVTLVRPRVRDVLPGSLLTAGAYAAGQWVLVRYLTSSARFDALGAFGAFLGFLVWAYYTALIVLWGAELTYQIAKRRACARGGEDTAPYRCELEAAGLGSEAT